MTSKRPPTATGIQARRLLKQKADDYREPSWRTDPHTATERQAAGLLAEQTMWDDLGGLTATQLQAAALLGTLPADEPDDEDADELDESGD